MTGFIVRNKAKGNYYYYIRRSYRKNGIVYKKNIFALGKRENALKLILAWINSEMEIPKELEGFTIEDFESWRDYINK